jgi:hypothetical protein
VTPISFQGDWLIRSDTTERLNRAGYMVGTFVDKGVRTYTLHTKTGAYGPEMLRYPVVHETPDLSELNDMVKLLLPPEG